MEHKIVVIGAGAAGTWVAWRVAEAGAKNVLLLEKTPRVGTKILASGGSRCNLTTTLGPSEAGRLFGEKGKRFLRRAFGVLPPKKLREAFAAIGVESEDAPLEKVFPKSGSAKDVRDALEHAARKVGVEIELSQSVVGIRPADDSGWWIETADTDGATQQVHASQLVLATGGQSFASTGTTGDGYKWLRNLGLQVTDLAPALTPLVSPEAWVHGFSGLALQNVELRLIAPNGKEIGRRRRPLLFTHLGVSGPGPMDLSREVARTPGDYVLRVDMLPDTSRDHLRDTLILAAGRPGAPLLQNVLSEVLSGLAGEPIPRRIIDHLLSEVGISSRAGHQALGRASRHDLIELVKGLPIAITGTAGYDKAEVTSGGLALSEVDPGTCRVRSKDDLWVVGELLDLDGPIGGLNFQSAFATAEVAAKDLTKNLLG